MSTINSSTTYHNRPQERKFANKLFIGLALLVATAILIAIIAGQKRELKPAGNASPAENSTSLSTQSANSMTNTEPISNQPKK